MSRGHLGHQKGIVVCCLVLGTRFWANLDIFFVHFRVVVGLGLVNSVQEAHFHEGVTLSSTTNGCSLLSHVFLISISFLALCCGKRI